MLPTLYAGHCFSERGKLLSFHFQKRVSAKAKNVPIATSASGACFKDRGVAPRDQASRPAAQQGQQGTGRGAAPHAGDRSTTGERDASGWAGTNFSCRAAQFLGAADTLSRHAQAGPGLRPGRKGREVGPAGRSPGPAPLSRASASTPATTSRSRDDHPFQPSKSAHPPGRGT